MTYRRKHHGRKHSPRSLEDEREEVQRSSKNSPDSSAVGGVGEETTLNQSNVQEGPKGGYPGEERRRQDEAA